MELVKNFKKELKMLIHTLFVVALLVGLYVTEGQDLQYVITGMSLVVIPSWCWKIL